MPKYLVARQGLEPRFPDPAGLQVADILAHPSRNEILSENGLLKTGIAPFASRVIEILQGKYDRQGEKVFGKTFL